LKYQRCTTEHANATPWKRTSRPQLRSSGKTDSPIGEQCTIASQWLIVVPIRSDEAKQQNACTPSNTISGVKLSLNDITVRRASLKEKLRWVSQRKCPRRTVEHANEAQLQHSSRPRVQLIDQPRYATMHALNSARHWLIVVLSHRRIAERQEQVRSTPYETGLN
jgi:hypothetical protein